jgi:protein-tyrosine-phosphatase
MKILFVCQANVGRSQVAHGFFGSISKHEPSSAGTEVEQMMAEFPASTRMVKDALRQKHAIPDMRKHGIDISENLRDQLTPEMVDEADKVIVIADREAWPDYLNAADNVTAWDFPDPVGRDAESAGQIFDEIKRRVEELVAEIG